MFICNCNAIRESELRKIARHVPCCSISAYAALGKTPQCGQCLTDAEDILREEQDLGAAAA